MISPEGFIMSTIVAAFVTDNAQQLVPLAIQNAAQRKTFGERHLGRIFAGATVVENRPGQVNRNDLGKHGDPHVSCDSSLGRGLRGGEVDPFRRVLRIRVESVLDPRDFTVQLLQFILRRSLRLGNPLAVQCML